MEYDRKSMYTYMLFSRHRQRGVTLIETLVAISLMTLLTVLGMRAIPTVRHNQRLVSDTELVQFLLRQAERSALNESRDEECLELAGEDEEIQKRCSTIGVALQDSTAWIFADMSGDRRFTAEHDFVIEQHTLASTAVFSPGTSSEVLLFEATPPTIVLYANGAIVGTQTPAVFELVSGSQRKPLYVYPFGLVQDSPST